MTKEGLLEKRAMPLPEGKNQLGKRAQLLHPAPPATTPLPAFNVIQLRGRTVGTPSNDNGKASRYIAVSGFRNSEKLHVVTGGSFQPNLSQVEPGSSACVM